MTSKMKQSIKKMGHYRTTTTLRALLMLGVDLVGYICLFPYVIFRRIKGLLFSPDNINRIAIFRLDGIGDLILSQPALNSLRKNYPNAHITLFINDWAEGLSPTITDVDEIIALKSPLFKRFKQKTSFHDFLSDRQLMRSVSKKPFDMTIDLRGDFLSIVTAWNLNSRWLLSRSSRAGGFLLTNIIHQPNEGKIKEWVLNTQMIEHITSSSFDAIKPQLNFPSSDHLSEHFHRQQSLIGNDYITLAVSAPYRYRNYPKQRWVELNKLIRTIYPHPILLLGHKNDFPICDFIAQHSDPNTVNLAGQYTLTETVACIAQTRLFIGNDGGLAHIASAFNRALIQLFGCSNSKCFGHNDNNEFVIQKYCPYSPCIESNCYTSENWCMERIVPIEIFDIAQPYLSSFCSER